VLFFVDSYMYYHMTLGVGHVGTIMGTTSHFQFDKNRIGFEWGNHGFGDEIFGLAWGFTPTSKF
jgi:hypothetical protein